MRWLRNAILSSGCITNVTLIAAMYFILAHILISLCKATVVPSPNGTYAVGFTTTTLIDTTRIDPYDPDRGARNVTVSLFYPLHRDQCNQICATPYMPPRTAAYYSSVVSTFGVSKNDTFESFKIQYCCEPSLKALESVTERSLVLFSAGLGGSRRIYTILAQELASAGYAVATLDSTYGSVLVEYPDGTYVSGKDISYWCLEDPPGFCKPTANVPPLLETNVQDAQFVLDTLGNHPSDSFPIPGAERGFNVSRVVYAGHSFGGATAIRASMLDDRIAGAVNLDGAQFGNITDSHAAVLLFGRSDPSPHNKTDDVTWQDTWDHLKGWRREIGVRGTQHSTFGDMALLAKLDGWPITEKLQTLIGTLDGQRSFDLVLVYLMAFIEFALEGKNSDLFSGSSYLFPEVVVDPGV